MGDTGIDVNHCFFADTSVTFPNNVTHTDNENVPYYINGNARKIVYYRAIADFADGHGHGTHCAGSMVGAYQTGEGRTTSSTPFTSSTPLLPFLLTPPLPPPRTLTPI